MVNCREAFNAGFDAGMKSVNKTAYSTISIQKRGESYNENLGITIAKYDVGDYALSVRVYDDGYCYFTVSKSAYGEEYLPDIYMGDSYDSLVTVQTTSYGALAPSEIQKVIDGLEYACDVADAIARFIDDEGYNIVF